MSMRRDIDSAESPTPEKLQSQILMRGTEQVNAMLGMFEDLQ